MVRNAIESDYRVSKKAPGGHLVKIFLKNIKVADCFVMAKNAIESDYRASPFYGKKKSKKKYKL